MKTAVIKYNAGNTQSVIFALQRLGAEVILTSDPEELAAADKVIFPGVGEASSTMKHLREHNLDKIIKDLKQPVLGICLGMQLMCSHSEEGNTDCMNIFNQKVVRFRGSEKIPHMGWNSIGDLNNPLFNNISEDSYVYFVHSYYAEIGENTISKTDYITPFSSALHKDNFYALQFHPEKSGKTGETILTNFLSL
jgi:imidazole glycerol-phosphate synthase subunit HisH